MVPGPGSPIAVGAAPNGIATGDFNGDGNLDLAVANRDSNSVSVLLGDGRGAFKEAPGSPLPAGRAPVFVVVGDINEDGSPDLLMSQHEGTYDVIRLQGDGQGGFKSFGRPLRTKKSTDPHGHGIALADVDGDSHLDLITLNAGVHQGKGDESISVFRGNGRGGFRLAAGSPIPIGGTPAYLAMADLNKDGSAELVTTLEAKAELRILLADKKGGFTPTPSPPRLAGPGLTLGDLDGDGNHDLVVTHGDRSHITILAGDGLGNFRLLHGAFPVGRNSYRVAVGDFNGDRRLDVALSNDASVTVLFGDGEGQLQPVPGSPFSVGENPLEIAVGDFNKDGKDDLAAANRRSNTVSILLAR
jgi:hypothetical protein